MHQVGTANRITNTQLHAPLDALDMNKEVIRDLLGIIGENDLPGLESRGLSRFKHLGDAYKIYSKWVKGPTSDEGTTLTCSAVGPSHGISRNPATELSLLYAEISMKSFLFHYAQHCWLVFGYRLQCFQLLCRGGRSGD